MSGEVTVRIDGKLKKRVLHRVGKSSGDVDVREERWDFGFCDTCSYPKEGFSVYVDGHQVWPSDEYLAGRGGYIYADDQGIVSGRMLSSWGCFHEWLEGRISFDYEDEDAS